MLKGARRTGHAKLLKGASTSPWPQRERRGGRDGDEKEGEGERERGERGRDGEEDGGRLSGQAA